MSEHALHFKSQMDCGRVVSITWCSMVIVAVLLCVHGEMTVLLWDEVGLNVVGWGGGKRWETSYTAQTHIHHN